MASHQVARLRFLALCVAVGCQTAAYAAVTVITLSTLQNGHYAVYRPATLAAWLGLCAVPALIAAPFIGPLAGSRWNRVILVGGTLVVAGAATAKTVGADAPWLSILGILSLELAFFFAAVLAVVDPAALAARLALTTAVWWLVAAAMAGPWVAMSISCVSGLAIPWQVFVAIALVAVLLGRVSSAESISLANGIVRPFLAGVREAVRHRRARSAVAGLWVVGIVGLTTVVAVVRIENVVEILRQEERSRQTGMWIDGYPFAWTETTDWRLLTGLLAGVLLTGLNRHPFRHSGFVLLAVGLVMSAFIWLRVGDSSDGPLTMIGVAIGLTLSPLISFMLAWTDPGHRGVVGALVVAGVAGSAITLAVILSNLGEDPLAARIPILNILLAVVAVALLGGIAAFFRPVMEITLEVLFWPIYRIRAVGPDVLRLPIRGPCVVVGNHAAWFDPLFFAKVLPSPITPMMSSKFYDLPVLSWLMRHVIGTIRVPDKSLRHEAPELKEAVAALDRGEYVVLFPEAYLRRKEEVPLRRFGRGVWQILRDRPGTPVFACWIEGGWGSFLSFRGGPPAKGKRPDLWQSIRIGVVGPILVDPVKLKDHMATRLYLMNQVSEARRPLGLEPLDLTAAPEAEGDAE